MFEEDLKVAKATLDLVKEELQAKIDAKSIKPEESLRKLRIQRKILRRASREI